MAKIVLVNPQIVTSSWMAKWRTTDDIIIRHSLSCLSAGLKQGGHHVVLADFRLMKGFEEYEALLQKQKPDFVGVTIHTCEHEAAIETFKRTKNIDQSILTIAGGIQATMFPYEFIKSKAVDFVIKGEGEISLPKLLENPQKFSSIFYGETPDLDTIPFEDRELWPDYFKRVQKRMIGFPGKTPHIDMLTKRGCPWQCKFCCGPGEQNLYTKDFSGKRIPYIRARSVENVMKELKGLHEKYKFKSIVFHDDQFILGFDWIEDFCKAMHDYGFVQRGITFWAAVRADIICRRPDLMQKLKQAGLEVCSIGFESFSDRMLEWMNKKITVKQNFKAANILQKLGIKIYANTILGMPFKDGKWYVKDDIATLEAIKKINPFQWSYSYFVPIPGSPFYQWFLHKKLIKDDSFESFGMRFAQNPKVRGVDYAKLDMLLKQHLSYRQTFLFKLIKKILGKIGLLSFAKKIYFTLKPV